MAEEGQFFLKRFLDIALADGGRRSRYPKSSLLHLVVYRFRFL